MSGRVCCLLLLTALVSSHGSYAVSDQNLTTGPFPDVFRVVTADRPPFVFVDRTVSGNAAYKGLLVDLLYKLFSEAGLPTDRFQWYTSPLNAGGSQLSNGTWTGVVGELQGGNADIAAFPFLNLPGRESVIDLTSSYMRGGEAMLVRQKKKPPDVYSFLSPFSYTLWLAIIGTIFVEAALQWVVGRLSPLGAYRERRTPAVSTPSLQPSRSISKVHVVRGTVYTTDFTDGNEEKSMLYESAQVMLGKRRGLHRGDSWAARLLNLGYLLFAVCITSAYTANLTAQLSTTLLTVQITSLKDLAALPNSKYARNADGTGKAYMSTTNQDPLVAEIAPRFVVATGGANDGLALLRNKTVDAYITEAPILDYFAGLKPCDVQVVGIQFGPTAQVLGLAKNSPYTDQISEAITRLQKSGYIDQLVRIWKTSLNQCAVATKNSSFTQLTVKHFMGLWYVNVGSVVAAALLLIVENLRFWYTQRSAKRLSRNGSLPEPPVHTLTTSSGHAISESI